MIDPLPWTFNRNINQKQKKKKQQIVQIADSALVGVLVGVTTPGPFVLSFAARRPTIPYWGMLCVMNKATKQASARELDGLYGRAYFFGETSGYPTSGYKEGHPDWAAWLDFLDRLKPGGLLLDVGCAYAYLVQEARKRGYTAFGTDISSFGLHQEPELAPYLVQALAAQLPFKAASFDVIALFDVLEHLDDWDTCLRDVVCLLKPDGLIVGATPDPIFFDRTESTHFSERPPSCWVSALEELGLAVRFRFSGVPYNFQFLATPRSSATADLLRFFGHDYFDDEADFVRTEGTVRALPRTGWGQLERNRRRLEASPASVYLLNSSSQPLRLQIRLTVFSSPEFSTLRIRLDSQVLQELYLTSEQSEHRLELEDVLLPSGGHHLFFEVTPGGPSLTVAEIVIQSVESDREGLTRSLPFDLYQRYQSSATIARRLKPVSILDVGGYIGDESGHLASAADFFQTGAAGDPTVTVTDLRDCDLPIHRKAPALVQPFPDASFDLVLSLDVIEHLPPDERPAFLGELDRLATRWIILGAPFTSPDVDEFESRLAASSLASRHFLAEHRQLGLPDPRLVEDYCVARGFKLLGFPNGNLRRWAFWQTVTQHYFSLNDSSISQMLNRLYNELCYPWDHEEPCYRTIYLILKRSASEEELRQLSRPPASPSAGVMERLTTDSRFYEVQNRALELIRMRSQATSDVQFLINERQKLIRCLENVDAEFRAYREQSLWRIARERMKQRA